MVLVKVHAPAVFALPGRAKAHGLGEGVLVQGGEVEAGLDLPALGLGPGLPREQGRLQVQVPGGHAHHLHTGGQARP